MPTTTEQIRIINPAGEDRAPALVLQQYFGRKDGQTLQDFMSEVKVLTPGDKLELTIGAAHALGWSVLDKTTGQPL